MAEITFRNCFLSKADNMKVEDTKSKKLFLNTLNKQNTRKPLISFRVFC